MLALLFVYQVSLDCPAVWCSEREVLALEHKLDIFVLRRKQIINLIENRCFVLATVRLVGSSNRKMKQVVVDSWIATEEVRATQYLSYAENFSDLLGLT
jgi:hypothetical protein